MIQPAPIFSFVGFTSLKQMIFFFFFGLRISPSDPKHPAVLVETMTAGEVEMWATRLGVSVDGRRLVAGLSGADLLALADDLERISAGLIAVRDRRAHAERYGGAVSHADLLDGTKVHTWADHLSDPGLPVEEAPADNGRVDKTLPGTLAVADWKVADVVRWARGLGFSDVFEKLLITELVVNEVSGADLPDVCRGPGGFLFVCLFAFVRTTRVSSTTTCWTWSGRRSYLWHHFPTHAYLM